MLPFVIGLSIKNDKSLYVPHCFNKLFPGFLDPKNQNNLGFENILKKWAIWKTGSFFKVQNKWFFVFTSHIQTLMVNLTLQIHPNCEFSCCCFHYIAKLNGLCLVDDFNAAIATSCGGGSFIKTAINFFHQYNYELINSPTLSLKQHKTE